jgi:phosphatidylglycerophosphatase A
MTRVALAIATAAGAGYSPLAPGTVGSAVGILIYFLTWKWSATSQIVLLLGLTIVGTWASSVAARHFKREDPGYVVIDEVAGQLLTLLLTGVGIGGAVVGFFVFRVLDIVKPWPAGRLEALPGGFGIMADDLMAGVYGWLIMRGLAVMLAGLW